MAICTITLLAGNCDTRRGSIGADLSEAMRPALLNGTTNVIQAISQCISDGISDGSTGNIDPDQSADLYLPRTDLQRQPTE